MTASQEFHLVYKNIGETPLQCANRFKKENQEFQNSKITYAGRLDPMAEGLLILLTNDFVKQKENYLKLDKEYEFEVLWGINTDTNDLLGLSNKKEKYFVPSENEIKTHIDKQIGKLQQKYPAFSSKPIDGKPLFSLARLGKLFNFVLPSHEVEIYKIQHLERRIIKPNDLSNIINERINKVIGDFRQQEIINNWQKILKNSDDFYIDKFSIKVSSGFYIRQFVFDLANNFNTLATTYSIKRTKIGDYCIAKR